MARHLYAMHDYDPAWAARVQGGGVTAWAVISEGIGDDAQDRSGGDYTHLAAYGVTPLVRLNYSHHGQGTIPLPARYDAFAARCAAFVAASRGCTHWIVGNEPNHSQERPQGTPVPPTAYAACFARVRQAVKGATSGTGSSHQVIVAAVAPWNLETGHWLDYWRALLAEIARRGGADGLALHTYTHGADPSLVASEVTMAPPYNALRWHFRAYRDFLAAVPDSLRHLPAYITETNQGDSAWQDANTGWVQAAYREIHTWNGEPGTQKVHCMALYRWHTYDRFGISDKPGVIADWGAAMQHKYESPSSAAVGGTSGGSSLYIPVVGEGPQPGPPPSPLPRQWDPRLTARGVKVEEAAVQPGQTYWRLVAAQWFDEQEADRVGPDHHILVDALDEQGRRVEGVSFVVSWPSGTERITTKLNDGYPWAADYAMSKSLNEFAITAVDGAPSDRVTGLGMGADGNSGVHTSTLLVFQRTVAPAQAGTPSQTGIVIGSKPQPATVPELVHPVADPRYRVVTQPFGANPDYYRQFSVDGVALKGHNGIDFGTPMGSQIVAVADGRVVEVADDPQGYGLYVKLSHAWGESLYAHLSRQDVTVGQQVRAGQVLGLSGNSGNSSGPHLHFGLRVAPFNRKDGWGGYSDPAPYLESAPAQPVPSQASSPLPASELWPLIVEAAREFGVDAALLGSLAYGESSFRVRVNSPAGAMGLMGLMPATWGEWAGQVGAKDPYNPRDNLRVGAAYLAWLGRVLGGDVRRMLTAYNWGVGRVLDGGQPPAETREYVRAVLFGADVLRWAQAK